VFTDGQKEKSITIYLAVHSVHLADIINIAILITAVLFLNYCNDMAIRLTQSIAIPSLSGQLPMQ